MRLSSLCLVAVLSPCASACQLFVDSADGSGGKGGTNTTTSTGGCKMATYVDVDCAHSYCEPALACSRISSADVQARCGAFCAAAAAQCSSTALEAEGVCCSLCAAFEGGDNGNDKKAFCDHVEGLETDSCDVAALGKNDGRAARVICQIYESACNNPLDLQRCEKKLEGAALDGECVAPLEDASDAAACVLKAARGSGPQAADACSLFLAYVTTQ